MSSYDESRDTRNLYHHSHSHGSLPNSPPRFPTNYFRKGHFLLEQEETPPGALGQLLRRNRSYGSIHGKHGSSWRNAIPAALDDEETGLLHSLAGTEHDDLRSPRSHSEDRRMSQVLNSTQMRSMRLIGNSNPKYKWARYWKPEEQIRTLSKPLQGYYERTNYLIQQYLYIDRLLDSSLPHDLLNEYNDLPRSSFKGVEVPDTISEEAGTSPLASFRDSALVSAEPSPEYASTPEYGSTEFNNGGSGETQPRPRSSSMTAAKKVKRTPKDIYRATETTPLFNNSAVEDEDEDEDDANGNPKHEIPWLEEEEDIDSGHRIVALAIYVNFAANVILLAGKIAVVASVPSMSVLASLVDAVLDFLSTVIVWTTTWLISRQDQYEYPVGRRRLEPLGVLVFSIIMITSFVQVALESTQRLASPNHELIEL